MGSLVPRLGNFSPGLNRARQILGNRSQRSRQQPRQQRAADITPTREERCAANDSSSCKRKNNRNENRKQFCAVAIALVGTLIALIEQRAQQQVKAAIYIVFRRC